MTAPPSSTNLSPTIPDSARLHSADSSSANPRAFARATAIFFLLSLLTGVVAQGFVADRLIVAGNAAATAANISAHRGLYELAFAIFMIEMACQVTMSVMFYLLLRPAGRSIALVALALGLTGAIIKTAARAFFLMPLFLQPASGTQAFSAFSTEQVQALGLALISINNRLAGIGLAFFGFDGLLRGWLILKSRFLPHWLGVLSLIAGAGWTTWIFPSVGRSTFLPLVIYALVTGSIMIFYLLVYTVDEKKWREQAAGM